MDVVLVNDNELAGLLGLGKSDDSPTLAWGKVLSVSGDTVTANVMGGTVSAVRCCDCSEGDVIALEGQRGRWRAVGRKGGGGGGGGDYLPLAGGTITGSLTVNGSLNAVSGIQDANNAEKTIKLAYSGASLADASYLLGAKDNGDGTIIWKDVSKSSAFQLSHNATDIASGSDLNDYTTPGVYRCYGDTQACSNAPTNNGFVLVVSYGMSNSVIRQEYYPYYAWNGAGVSYSRYYIPWATPKWEPWSCSGGIDAIVSEGDTSGWHWVKYANGFAECWLVYEGDINVRPSWNPYSPLYYANAVYYFPFSFVSTPTVMTNRSGGNLVWTTLTERYNNSAAVRLLTNGDSSLYGVVYIYAAGRWKL